MIIEELRAAGGADDGRAAFLHLPRSAPAADHVLPRHLDPRPSAAAAVAAQVIEIAPGLDIEPLDRCRAQAGRGPGGDPCRGAPVRLPRVARAYRRRARGQQSPVLDALGATAGERPPPKVLASRIITSVDPQHAFLVNSNKLGSMVLPASHCSFSRCSRPRTRSSPPTRPRRRPDQGGRLPDDRCHRPRLPVRPEADVRQAAEAVTAPARRPGDDRPRADVTPPRAPAS